MLVYIRGDGLSQVVFTKGFLLISFEYLLSQNAVALIILSDATDRSWSDFFNGII